MIFSSTAQKARPWGGFPLPIWLLGVGSLAFVMLHFGMSPPPRIAPVGAKAPALTTAPAPPAAPASMAPPSAPLSAQVAPSDPESIAFLIQHPDARPREVALLVSTRFELLTIGVPKGALEAQPGTKVTLLNVTGDSVDVAFGGATKRLPIAATDLTKIAPETIATYHARVKAENRNRPAPWNSDQRHASLFSRSE